MNYSAIFRRCQKTVVSKFRYCLNNKVITLSHSYICYYCLKMYIFSKYHNDSYVDILFFSFLIFLKIFFAASNRSSRRSGYGSFRRKAPVFISTREQVDSAFVRSLPATVPFLRPRHTSFWSSLKCFLNFITFPWDHESECLLELI